MDSHKPQIKILVLGGPDTGKATTLSFLIEKCGTLTQSNTEKIKPTGTEGSNYGGLGHLENEGEEDVSEKLSNCNFKSDKMLFKVIAIPGHKNFIKNLVIGTSQADVGLLIIDASVDNFEEKALKEGQTFEQSSLAHILGIKQIIVAVNKMDEKTVNWSQARFDDVRNFMIQNLEKIGFSSGDIQFIPISGLYGDNLFEGSKNLTWFTGPTLLQALENVPIHKNHNERPLRLPLQDVYKISGVGTVPVGRVESGTLKLGMTVCFVPGDVTTQVGSFETIAGGISDTAYYGDNIGFSVKNLDVKDLKRGLVCGDPKNDPPKTTIDFDALVVFREDPGQIKVGSHLTVDCHTAHVVCQVKEIQRKICKKNGVAIEHNPKTLGDGDCAIIKLVPTKPLCVETFSDYPSLGKFGIRGDQTQNVGIGLITSVQKEKK